MSKRSPPPNPPEAAAQLAVARKQAGIPIYLTEREFCERYQVGPRTAIRMRVEGGGPPFVRISQRNIRYRLTDCEAWAAARTFADRRAELAQQAA